MNPREMCALIESAANSNLDSAQYLLHLRFFGTLYEQRLVKSGLVGHGLRLDWTKELEANVREV